MRKTVMERVKDHYDEATQYFKPDNIVGVFLQGSQNYGLEIENSDVDTKLIVVPTLDEIASNKKAISTTHIRANDEHIDFKDIRLYMETFRKQNLNFLEILFTPYSLVNASYKEQWDRLVEYREEIAHMNPYRAVKSMKGIAMEKFHAMEHEYPSKVDVLKKYGYDPKQLHHLLRVEDYLDRYIKGESYEDCLRPTYPEYLKDVKRGFYDLEDARKEANRAINKITFMADCFCERTADAENPEVRALLEDVQFQMIRDSLRKEVR